MHKYSWVLSIAAVWALFVPREIWAATPGIDAITVTTNPKGGETYTVT